MNAALPTGAESPRPGDGSLRTVRFPVSGMTCGSCVNRITRALKRLDGVDRVRVDLVRELATVRHDPSVSDHAALALAVEAAGYEAHLDAVVTASEDDLRGPLARLLGRLRTAHMKENLE